jgi:DNA replication and repair protein RecF
MFVETLNLLAYRNYLQAELEFNKDKCIIIGDNSQGKTNLLEVLQLLSTGRARRAKKDAELVHFGSEHAVINATISKYEHKDLNLALMIRPSGRRSLKINTITKKPGELLQNLFSVSFMVDDLEIVSGSPSKRRDWLDVLLKQLYAPYKDALTKFEKVLSQRNSFIKNCLDKGINHRFLAGAELEQLEIWDDIYLEASNMVTKYRSELLELAEPICELNYQNIAKQEVSLKLNYQHQVLSREDLTRARACDWARAHTSQGAHRDDVIFELKELDASSFASQGEKRSLVLALKLMELKLIQHEKNLNPILLLDDVLAELDENRQDQLLEAVDNQIQVFITTTHLGKHLKKWSENAQILTVSAGNIKPLQLNSELNI